MPLPETIRATLVQAAATGEVALLHNAFNGLWVALNENSAADRADLDLLVLCAETALQVHEVDVAAECLEAYFLESCRYGAAFGKVELADQFLCRAYYARARVESARTRVLKGQDLITGTLDALKFLQQGLAVAKPNPRYAFLVYNGTVHYWHVSRPLQRDGMRSSLLPSQEAFVQALVASVAGQEEWKARCLGALAMCYAEAGKPDDALKAFDQAIPLAEAFPDLSVELRAAKVHIGQVSGKGKADTAPATEAAARALLQTIKSQPALPREQVETQLADVWKKVDPEPEASARDVNLHVVADVAWTAAQRGLLGLARSCANRANTSQDLLPRVWSDLTVASLDLQALGEARFKLGKRTVKALCGILESLDQTLSQFKRLRVPAGVQDTARMIWNTGLVLLQPNLRVHVKRAFAAAAKALEEIESPLNRLRAALHLEVAKADYLDEVFPKAAGEVRKGLALDYIAPEAEIKRFRLQRPLDRYLEPMYEALDLKTSITRLPETELEQVVLALERAKDVRNPEVKAAQLKRLIDLLLALEPAPPPAATDDSEERTARQHAARQRTIWWCEVVKAAWSVRLDQIVIDAAPHALAAQWDPAVDAEMVVAQAEVAFIEVDALAYALTDEGEELNPPDGYVPPAERLAEEDGKPSGPRKPPFEIEELQERLPDALLEGMELGLRAGQPWLVLNGAVNAWNYYIHFLNGQHMAAVERVFKAVVDRLFQMDQEAVDPVLVCALAGGFAQGVEHRVMLGVLGVPWPPPEEDEEEGDLLLEEEDADDDEPKPKYSPLGVARDAATKMLGGKNIDEADVAELKPAIEVLEGAIQRAGESPSQTMLETYARLLKLCGREPALPASVKGPQEAAGKVISIIEKLSTQSDLETTQLEAQVQSAVDHLSSMGDTATPEFWAKLAQVALQVRAVGQALTCARRASRAVFGDDAALSTDDIQDKSDAPDVADRTWYWLSLAEVVHGQAIVALVKPGAQARSVQSKLRLLAISHFTAGARFGLFINRKDLVESAARCLWNAVGDFLASPVTRRLLARPLQGLVTVLNRTGCSDPDFQVHLNCLLLECLGDGQEWQKGVRQANDAFKSLKNTLHLPLWEYKTAFLAKSGVNVAEEMGIAKQYAEPVHARAWQLLGQQLGGHYDQLAARKQALDTVKKMPWVKYEFLLEYAEWLVLETGEPDAAEEALWAAIDIVTEVEVAQDDEDAAEDDGQRSTSSSRRSGSRVGSRAGSKAGSRAGSRRVGSRVGSRSGSRRSGRSRRSVTSSARTAVTTISETEMRTVVDLKAPTGLEVRHMEALCRAFTLLAHISAEDADRKEYALTAHYYAMRMTAATFQAAANAPPLKGEKGADGKRGPPPETPPVPPMPEQLQDWASWEMDGVTKAALGRVRFRDKQTLISRRSIACPELTMRYLEFLADILGGLGLHLHTLPVLQLHGLVARLAAESSSLEAVSQLLLASALESVGAVEAAAAAIARAGEFRISAEDLHAAQHHIDQMNTVKAVLSDNMVGLSRWRGSGRFSFLPDSKQQADGGGSGGKPGEGHPLKGRPNELECGRLQCDPFDEGIPEAGAGADAVRVSSQLEPGFVEAVSEAGIRTGGRTPRAGASPWLVMAPLQPVTPAEVWIRKAQWLVAHGQYGRARELVDKAYEWAESQDEAENRARCLLIYAEMAFLARDHTRAVVQVQEAQRIGGNLSFWCSSVLAYCKYRRFMPNHMADCRSALEGCIELCRQLSKDNAAAAAEATATAAGLTVSLAAVLLEEVAEKRRSGQSCAEPYAAAVAATEQSMHACSILGGAVHAGTIMAHVKVLMDDPSSEPDSRPHLTKVLHLLKEAERLMRAVVEAAREPDMDPALNLPCARMLSQVLTEMAQVGLALAREREVHEHKDRSARRPEFPRATESAGDNPVARFLDETEQLSDEGVVRPEQEAVVWATAAASLSASQEERAAALLRLGEAVAFQFFCRMPGGFLNFSAWTPLVVAPAPAPAQQQEPKVEDLSLEAQQAPLPPVAEVSESPTAGSADTGGGEAAAATPPAGVQEDADTGAPDGGAPEEGASPAEAAAQGQPPPADGTTAPGDAATAPGATEATDDGPPEPEPHKFQLWPAPADIPPEPGQLRIQATLTLEEAIKAAVQEQRWDLAEQAALNLADCHGDTLDGQSAASAVILAQSYAAVAYFQHLYLDACASSDLEALLIRQKDALKTTSPLWSASGMSQRNREHLRLVGRMSDMLRVDEDLPTMLGAMPASCRVLALHLSPDQRHLYAACLNGPAKAPAADKQPPATKKGAPAPEASPSDRAACTVRLPVDGARLAALIQAVRDHRRSIQKTVENQREPLFDPAAGGAEAVQAAAAAKKKGAKGKSGKKGKAGKGKGSSKSKGTASRRISTASSTGTGASSTGDGQQTLQQRLAEEGKLVLYDPSINNKWRQLLAEMEDFFKPLQELLREFFPGKADPAPHGQGQAAAKGDPSGAVPGAAPARQAPGHAADGSSRGVFQLLCVGA
eukprot:jgi/Tetstr1/435413/TSEL_024322.t1